MEKLVCKKQNKSVIAFILDELGELNYNGVQKLLRKKDIKINGTRIKQDQAVCVGDIVEVYAELKSNSKLLEIIHADNQIVVVNKPAGIEVVSETGECLLSVLQKQLNKKLFAVHRLDRNTTGLVVFASDINTKEVLDSAIKTHKLGKYYLTVVVGKPKKQSEKLVAYHKKDSANSICYIGDSPSKGYTKIITNYKLIKTNEILSLLEVEIETGKTHQIRAHLAHKELPVLGDEKYGNKLANKQYKKKKQLLVAYKLDFRNIKGLNVSVIELPRAKEQFEYLF